MPLVPSSGGTVPHYLRLLIKNLIVLILCQSTNSHTYNIVTSSVLWCKNKIIIDLSPIYHLSSAFEAILKHQGIYHVL